MRINSGKYKYRNVVLPDDIRPTTAKVREAMFSMMYGHIEGAYVLDLFAGSGSLGLEALSRGAEFCYFNEISRKNLPILKGNIANCGAEHECKVYNKDFRKCLANIEPGLDIIIMDPPYAAGYYDEAFDLINEYELLNPGGIVVAEHLYDNPLQDNYGKLVKIREKKYGTIGVDIYSYE